MDRSESTVALGRGAVEKALKHFGVKGMKWGIRRKRGPDGTVSSNPSASDDAVRAVTTASTIKKSGSLNTVSSKDLQHLVDRMNLEQKYVKMTTETQTISKGENFIKKVIKNELNSLQTTGKPSAGVRLIGDLLDQKTKAPEYKNAGKRKIGVPIAKPKAGKK